MSTVLFCLLVWIGWVLVGFGVALLFTFGWIAFTDRQEARRRPRAGYLDLEASALAELRKQRGERRL